MTHEFGPALRASCAFVSHIMLAHRVLPLIEDWLPATRTRKVCRHSDSGTQGMYPAATQSRPERPKPASGRSSPERPVVAAPSGIADSGGRALEVARPSSSTTNFEPPQPAREGRSPPPATPPTRSGISGGVHKPSLGRDPLGETSGAAAFQPAGALPGPTEESARLRYWQKWGAGRAGVTRTTQALDDRCLSAYNEGVNGAARLHAHADERYVVVAANRCHMSGTPLSSTRP